MRRLVWTFVALLLLTGLAFGVSFVPLGPWGSTVAMSIALGKSVLIALFFMHLAEHAVSSRITIAVAVALAIFLVGFALLDVQTRESGSAEGGATTTGASLQGAEGSPRVEELSRGSEERFAPDPARRPARATMTGRG